MAVSYSNNLRLAVITTGTEAGLWGTYTNDNFQYAVEQAIGGAVTLSFGTSTSQTLTQSSNNGLQDFRALYLTCNGTPASAATLTVPSIQKMYIVKNNLGQQLTVKIGSSTGSVVAAGRTAILYANGTDVVATQDYFADVIASGNASFGGTLAVTGNSTLSGSLTVGTSATTSGTYSRVLTTVTVTSTGHGFLTGQVLYLNFTSGTATSGVYSITVVDANTFTVTDTVSGSTSGNVSITRYANSTTLNSAFVLPAAFGSSGTANQVLVSQGSSVPPKWETPSGVSGAWTVGGAFIANGASTFNGNTTVGSTTVTAGTYGRSGTTVTVTSNAHGFSNGQVLYLVFSAGTGGTATSGVYTISNVATNTFDVTDTASGTITGSPAVSITKYNNTATLQAPLSSFGSFGTSGQVLTSQGTGAPPQWTTVPITSVNTFTGAVQSVLVRDTAISTATTSFTGSTSGASTTLTASSITGTIQVGQVIAGTNIVAGTRITAVNGSTLTISPASSGTVSGTVTVVGVDFFNIPTWAKRITVMFAGVSTNGSSNLLVQLGNSGGFVTTGYISTASNQSGSNLDSATTGFLAGNPIGAAEIYSGLLVITKIDSSGLVYSSTMKRSTGAMSYAAGNGSVSNVTQLRVTTVGGVDTFDAGTINIMYE